MNFYSDFTPELEMWFNEAHQECMRAGTTLDTRYAIYPKRFYKTVEKYDKSKLFDFCFIGGLHTDKETYANRKWILDFIREKFSDASYLQFTDKKTKINHRKLGNFDYTLDAEGFVPKECPAQTRAYFDENYYKRMCNSKFTLCPAGDVFYSMRFYEALMCRSIPIVKHSNESFRSQEESFLDYKYYLTEDNIEYREDWVEHNCRIFLKYHTLDKWNHKNDS